MRYLIMGFCLAVLVLSCNEEKTKKLPDPPVKKEKKQYPTPVLNARGEYWLYYLNWSLGAGNLMAVSAEEYLDDKIFVRLDLDSCIVIGLDRKRQLKRIHELFKYGVEQRDVYAGINVYTDGRFFYSWKPLPGELPDLKAEPDTVNRNGFHFLVRNSDSTYAVYVKRHPEKGIDIPDFKLKYLHNCITEQDTFQAILKSKTGRKKWRMDGLYKPTYMENNNGVYEHTGFNIDFLLKKERIELKTDSVFTLIHHVQDRGDKLLVTSGKYKLVNDSLLYLNSTAKSTTTFLHDCRFGIDSIQVIEPFFVMNKMYVLKDNRIYFVNAYR